MKAVVIEQFFIYSWFPQPISTFTKPSEIIDCILHM